LSHGGGRGAAPKHPDQRRNRNPKAGGEWVVLPKEGFKGSIPSLEGEGLSKPIQKWWRMIWRTPMATQWTSGDVPALLELAHLKERLADGKVSVASEVRLRSDHFGLTPKGRQERRWVITEEDAARAGTDEVAAARNRRRLAAVEPESLGQ
jgi:hypothetical protein